VNEFWEIESWWARKLLCRIVKGIACILTSLGQISAKVFPPSRFPWLHIHPSSPLDRARGAIQLTDQNQSPSDPIQKQKLPIESDEPPVPAFGCVVYFSSEAGVLHGRVANLAGIQATAPTQRELLGQIVAQFKSAVSKRLSEGETPDWVDPPLEKREGEQKLFLPVHL